MDCSRPGSALRKRAYALRGAALWTPSGDGLPGGDLLRPRAGRGALDRARAACHARLGPRVGHRRGRRTRRGLARGAPERVARGCLVDRLDSRRRGGAADRRRRDRARLHRAAALAAGRVHRLRARRRVGVVPDHDPGRPPEPPQRRPPRAPAGERQLPVRPHCGRDRGLCRSRPAADLEVQEQRLPNRRLDDRDRAAGLRRVGAHVSRHAPSARRRGRRGGRDRRSDRRWSLPAAQQTRRPPRRGEGRGRRALGQDARRRAARASARARSRGSDGAVLVRGAEEPQGAGSGSSRLEGGC